MAFLRSNGTPAEREIQANAACRLVEEQRAAESRKLKNRKSYVITSKQIDLVDNKSIFSGRRFGRG